MDRHLLLYKQAAELSKTGIWEFDIVNQTLYWDEVTKAIHEVPEDFIPVIETAINFYKEGDSRERIAACVQKTIETGEAYWGVFEIITAKGNERIVEARGQAMMQNGSCIKLLGTFKDITEQTKLELDLKHQKELFESSFEYASIGKALISPQGHWLKVNKAICNIVGYSKEELMQLTFQDITHPEDLDLDLAFVSEMLEKKRDTYSMFKRYFHKDGHIVWVKLSVSLVWNEDGSPRHFISQIEDVTHQKLIEQQLSYERTRLEGILEGTNVGTWEWNVQTGETIFNERWANIIGYTLEELLPFSIDTWVRFVHPEDLQESNRLLTECFEKQSDYYYCECRMKHKEGHWIWVLDRGKVISWTEDGKPLWMMGTRTDITQRKKQEEEKIKQLEIIAEQNKRLLTFAHIVSHNLRSHAGNFQMMIDILQDPETDDVERTKVLELLNKNAIKLSTTIDNLNEVVEIQTNIQQQKVPIKVKSAIQEVMLSIQASIATIDAKIELLMGDDATIIYNKSYFDSIVLNFITNSIK